MAGIKNLPIHHSAPGEPDELSRRPSICPSGLGIGHSEVGNGKIQ